MYMYVPLYTPQKPITRVKKINTHHTRNFLLPLQYFSLSSTLSPICFLSFSIWLLFLEFCINGVILYIPLLWFGLFCLLQQNNYFEIHLSCVHVIVFPSAITWYGYATFGLSWLNYVLFLMFKIYTYYK